MRRYIPLRERRRILPEDAPIEDVAVLSPIPTADVDRLVVADELISKLHLIRRNFEFSSPLFTLSQLNGGHSRPITCIGWSPVNGSILASSSMDGALVLWNPFADRESSCRCVLREHSQAIRDFEWAPMDVLVASASCDSTVSVVDAATGLRLRRLIHDNPVSVARWNPSCRHQLLTSAGCRLSLWDIRTQTVVKEFPPIRGRVLDATFLQDGDAFVASCDAVRKSTFDQNLICFDTKTGGVLHDHLSRDIFTATSLAVHPSGEFFAAQFADGVARIFHTSPSYRELSLKKFEGQQVEGFPIRISFSPDGRSLFSGSADGCLFVFDWTSRLLLHRYPVSSNPCVDVRCHPKLSCVAAGCWDGSIVVAETRE